MQVGVLPDLEQRRAPDGADRLPGLDLVPGGDNGCGGQILIVRDAAVVVPDDDRRAEQLVVIDRRDRAVCCGPYWRALGGGQVDAVMRAPVARRGVEGQLLHAVRALRLAGHRPHADVCRLRVDLLVGLRDGRGFRRLSDGGRLACRRLCGRFRRLGRDLRLRGDRHRRLAQCVFLRDRAGQEQPARHADRADAERQHDVVALLAQKVLKTVGFGIFVVLHFLHLRG